MSDMGGDEIVCGRGTSPLDDDDLLGEILLRLPPEPSSLPRASLVCKRWRRICTDAPFRRRFRTHHHRNPPVVGVFEERSSELNFMPLIDPPGRIPPERFSLDLSADEIDSWSVLGCRHGRVLLLNRWTHVLLVFEPVSGDTHRILVPPEFVRHRHGFTSASAAVLCAAAGGDDHVHGDCHTSPFKVVVVGGQAGQPVVASVYSSETGMWGDLISTSEPSPDKFGWQQCILVGSALYWFLYGTIDTADDAILEFDLDNQSLTLIKPPVRPFVKQYSWFADSHIIRAEDGGLGLAILSNLGIQLWDRKVECHGVATWMPQKNINMSEMLGLKANSAQIVGYAEDADAIFMLVYRAPDCVPPGHALVIIQLQSMKVEINSGSFISEVYYPLTSFYTAGTARV